MQGYEADEFSDGLEAIDTLDRNHPAYDLAVVDSEMPLLSGIETLHALRTLQPGLQVLVCIAEEKRPGAGALPDGVAFLAKPFIQRDLSEALAKLQEAASRYQGPERRLTARTARSV
jgi:CheY-like chemotaxis protein